MSKFLFLVAILLTLTFPNGGFAMTDNEKELLDTLKLAYKYVGYSSTEPFTSDLLYRPPSTVLREQADAIDRKDSAIKKIREIIEKYEVQNAK